MMCVHICILVYQKDYSNDPHFIFFNLKMFTVKFFILSKLSNTVLVVFSWSLETELLLRVHTCMHKRHELKGCIYRIGLG